MSRSGECERDMCAAGWRLCNQRRTDGGLFVLRRLGFGRRVTLIQVDLGQQLASSGEGLRLTGLRFPIGAVERFALRYSRDIGGLGY